MDVIWVRSGTRDHAVVLWERVPEHPDGEVFVAGPASVQVATTPAVIARLRDGRLILDASRTPVVETSDVERLRPLTEIFEPIKPAGDAPTEPATGSDPPAASDATKPRRGRRL